MKLKWPKGVNRRVSLHNQLEQGHGVLRRRRYGLRRDRLQGGSERKKAQSEAPCAPERAPFEGGGVEGSPPTPPTKGKVRGEALTLYSSSMCRNGTFSLGTLRTELCHFHEIGLGTYYSVIYKKSLSYSQQRVVFQLLDQNQ